MCDMENSRPSQQTGETMFPPVLGLDHIVRARALGVGALIATMGHGNLFPPVTIRQSPLTARLGTTCCMG